MLKGVGWHALILILALDHRVGLALVIRATLVRVRDALIRLFTKDGGRRVQLAALRLVRHACLVVWTVVLRLTFCSIWTTIGHYVGDAGKATVYACEALLRGHVAKGVVDAGAIEVR